MNLAELGQTITTLRKAQGYTQQTLADNAGVSRATLNAIETARAGDVGVKKITKILAALGYELSLRERSPFPTFEELIEQNKLNDR